VDGPSRYPIETFDPLLRDLVSWGLVERDESAAGSWRLVDAAQRQLTEIVASTGPLSAESMLYFDHLCARCHQRELTRLVDGSYLCNSCTDAIRAEAMITDEPEVSERRQRLTRRRRRPRVEESGPIAS